MACGLNEKEEQVRLDKFGERNECADSEDLVFLFPNDFRGQPDDVVARLQRAMDYLKDVTNNLDPTRWFNDSRVVIGYIHGIKSAAWKSNDRDKHWIRLPWEKYLNKENEPFDILSHELVHPFYRVSKLHTKKQKWGGNEGWGDGFCDFLRGPIKNLMALDGNGWWQRMIEATEDPKEYETSTRNYPAGQFVKKYLTFCKTDEKSFSQFIDERQAIKEFVKWSFENFADRPLRSVLPLNKGMRDEYDKDGKI